MASIIINDYLTFDESAGLQNITATPLVSGDSDDNDVNVSTIPTTFSERLNSLLGETWDDFASVSGAAASGTNFVSVTGTTGTITSLGFVDDSGDALPVYGIDITGVLTDLTTLDGEAISLFADNSLGNRMVLGVDASGDVVFALYMQPTSSTLSSAQVWLVQFEPLHNPIATNPDDAVDLSGFLDVAATTSLDFNFNALPSGQNLFGIVGDKDSGLIVIGAKPAIKADGTYSTASDTINTSKGGGPTTIGINNQLFDSAGEGAYFTFVKTPDPNYLSGVSGGLTQNEADDADNILYGQTLEVTSAYVRISQLQGNSRASITITAFDIPDDPQGKDFVDYINSLDHANDSVDILQGSVVVRDANNNVVAYNTASSPVKVEYITATDGTVSAKVSGLSAGYTVEWQTTGPMDQVLITNSGGKFDIGGFGTTESDLITADIGGQIVFEDDGPSASLTKTAATVTVDETAGLQNAGSTEAGDKDDNEVAGTTEFGGVALTSVFAVTSPSSDLAAQYAVSGSALVTPDGSYGADEQGGSAGLTLALNLDEFDEVTINSGSSADVAVLTDLTTTDGQKIWLVEENGLIVGRVQTSADGDPLDLGDAALAVAIDETGKVATVQYASLTHPTSPSSYDEAVDLQSAGPDGKSYVLAVQTVTDGDDDVDTDSEPIGGQIFFEDDGPSASLTNTAATVTVDETTGLQNASSTEAGDKDDNEVAGTTEFGGVALTSVFAVTSPSSDLAAQYAVSGSALVTPDGSYGADEEDGTSVYSLALNTTNFSGVTVTSGSSGTAVLTDLTTTDGEKIWLVKEGELIVGRVQTSANGAPLTLGVAAFALAIDQDGNVATVQYESLTHPISPSAYDEAVDLSNVYSYVNAELTVTDGDNDVMTRSAGIGGQVYFEDDGPSIGPVSDGLVDFIAGSTVTHTLNGSTGSDQNPAPYVIESYENAVVVNGVTLTGVLSANKQQVDYIVDSNHNGAFDAGEEAYFRLTLDESGGAYTFDVLKNPPPASVDFTFDTLPSGQNLFGVVGTSTTGLIVIGEEPLLKNDGTFANGSDTINTSKGGGPTTIGIDNQMFDPGDGAYFTFVKSPVTNYLSGAPGGLDQNEADDADNIQYTGGTLEVNSAYVKISQIQGNSLATMKITAFDITDAPQGRDFVTQVGSGDPVDIIESSVRVYDASGTEVKWYEASYSGPVDVSDDSGSTVVTGLGAGYKVEWETDAPSDQVLIENVAGKFDIGGFGSTQATPTPDIALDFTTQVTDGDGDQMISNTFTIGIDGTGIYDDNTVIGVDLLV